MAVPFGVLMVAAALRPLLCGAFLATFTLERAFPANQPNLRRLVARDKARHGRMILQKSKGGVVDFPIGGNCDLDLAGLYYAKVRLGTPPRDFNVHIDTGSDNLWVSCIPCKGCPKATSIESISLNSYNPRRSSSSSLVPCHDKRCRLGIPSDDSSCSPDKKQCTYSILYGDNSTTSGYYVSDFLTGSSLASNSTASIIFGCSNVLTGNLADSSNVVDGIFGFGRHGISVISQLASQGISPRAFSHCLRGDSDGGGLLVLGEIREPNLVYRPLICSQFNYNLNLRSIFVNGQILPIKPSVFSTGSNKGAAIDTGTTLAYLPDEAYEAFVSAINHVVSSSGQVTPLDNQCYQINSSVTDIFPQVNLKFKGGAVLALSPLEYLVLQRTDDVGLWCMGFLKSNGYTILGGSKTVNLSIGLHSNAMRSRALNFILWSLASITFIFFLQLR